MSLPDVRVGRCGLCGWPCDGTLCPAHADCGNPVDDAAIDLHIAEMLSPSDTAICSACDLPRGHDGPHEATFLVCEASPGWTGSPEQWAAFRANPPRIRLVES